MLQTQCPSIFPTQSAYREDFSEIVAGGAVTVLLYYADEYSLGDTGHRSTNTQQAALQHLHVRWRKSNALNLVVYSVSQSAHGELQPRCGSYLICRASTPSKEGKKKRKQKR